MECTAGFQAIKYIYDVCHSICFLFRALLKHCSFPAQYVYKGPDRATMAIERECDAEEPVQRDEIRQYIDSRYVSALEAFARIMGWPTHKVPYLDFCAPLRLIMSFSVLGISLSKSITGPSQK